MPLFESFVGFYFVSRLNIHFTNATADPKKMGHTVPALEVQ